MAGSVAKIDGYHSSDDDDKDITSAPVLDAAAMLDYSSVDTIPVLVPSLGGIIHVRSMSGRDREEVGRLSTLYNSGQKIGVAIRPLVVSLTACDAEGKLLFTRGDCAKLASKPSFLLEELYEAALAVSGITGDENVGEAGKD